MWPSLSIPVSNPVWGSTDVYVGLQSTNPFNSDVSTRDTLQRMVRLILTSNRSPQIATVVDSCLSSTAYLSNPSKLNLVRTFFYWVKNHVKFVEDETITANYLTELGFTINSMDTAEGSIDLLISPDVLVSMPVPMGDCDDFTMLLGALVTAVGIQGTLIAICADPMQPTRWSHVFMKALIPDDRINGDGRTWIPLDASHGSYPGWLTKKAFRWMEWEII